MALGRARLFDCLHEVVDISLRLDRQLHTTLRLIRLQISLLLQLLELLESQIVAIAASFRLGFAVCLTCDRNLVFLVHQIKAIVEVKLDSRRVELHILVTRRKLEHIIEELRTDTPRAHVQIVELWRSQQRMSFPRARLPVHEERAVDTAHVGFDVRRNQVRVNRILRDSLIVGHFKRA